MKTKVTHFALALVLSISAFARGVKARDVPSVTPAQLTERTLHRRAVETVIWGMPAVNAELMFQAMRDAKLT